MCGLLPYFVENHQCLLLGREADLEEFRGRPTVEILPCHLETFSLKELFRFPSDLLRAINSCDAYYTPYCNIPGRLLGGSRLSGGIKVPIFSTIHDVVFLDIPELAGGLGTAVRKWFYQQAVNKSRCVFTVSQFSAQRIQTHLNCGAVPLVVTYNAVPHWFTESGHQEDNSSEKTVVRSNDLLFVGNIKAHKGLHILLEGFKQARQRGLEGRLVIVGNASNFRTGDGGILEQFQSMPEEAFSFTGRVSDSQLRDLYRQCRLLVQPSLYEGFGMPPLEALSQGANVVLSDIPVFKEIYGELPVTFFKAGDSGDLADKLLEAWKLPPPPSLDSRYSFKRSADIIFRTISEICGK